MVQTVPKENKCKLQWRAIIDEYMKRIPKNWGEDGEIQEYEEIPWTEFGAVLAEIERPIQEFYEKTIPLTEWVESLLPVPKGYTVYGKRKS